jgi:hypothetical protein
VAGCEAAAPAILGAVLTNTLMTVSALRLIASDGAISFSVVCALALPLSTIALNLVAEHATHRPPNWNAHLFAGARRGHLELGAAGAFLTWDGGRLLCRARGHRARQPDLPQDVAEAAAARAGVIKSRHDLGMIS